MYEVFDEEQQTTCALKLLPDVTPRALLRFKREFRALQGLSHPNLIRLGELLNDGDRWFFTMELVRGVDFRTYVRGEEASVRAVPSVSFVEKRTTGDAGATLTLDDEAESVRRPREPDKPPSVTSPSRLDEGRLRDALTQLARGLEFLHASGKVHRDVKPSNVLVSESGRVVLLDFGLVADRSGAGGATEDDGRVQGTLGYMAPEQARGTSGPAVDLYAMGVMLFEALTGTSPFDDRSIASVLLRAGLEPPRPSAITPGVPEDLDELCVRLLDPSPEKRPSARDVLEWLGTHDEPESTRGIDTGRERLVGRRRELEELFAAYRESADGLAVVTVEGTSGIGKTALVNELVAELKTSSEPPLVLQGRCYEHEGIPYKAIDGVIDELAQYLAQHPPSTWDTSPLPANTDLLCVLFPVLERVPDFSAHRSSSPDRAWEEPHRMRRDAEQALIALLAGLARLRRIVICIDDFQWADADSLTFLGALGRAPTPPPLLLVLTSRQQVQLPFEGRARRISLSPLPPDEARELASSLLAHAGESAADAAEAIAAEAGGNPFFVHELAWRVARSARAEALSAASVRLDDVLWDRISARHGPSREVLELVAVASAPLPQSVVAEAARLDPASFASVAQDLRAERLIRTTGLRPTDDVETYHDRIREAVVGKLDRATRASRHLALALATERQRPDDLDALVMHFEGGGDTARAGEYALRAGDAARAALAFERAASFYRRAIAHLPASRSRAERLRLKLADALANGGLSADAAIEFERAAAEAEPAEALELRRRAAEQWLSSGRLDEGLNAIRAVLSHVGVRVPSSSVTAFGSILLHRAKLRLRGFDFVERSASDVAPDALLRADALWAAAARLGAVDPIQAADFQARHLLQCLDLGEPFRIVRALLTEVIFLSTNGPRAWKQTQELLSRARSIASRIDSPYTTALAYFAEGLADYERGHYREGHASLERAAESFRTGCTGASHEIALSKRFAIDCLFNLGELDALRREVPLLLEDAQRRGDLYLAAELQTGLPNIVWLCADQPDEARRMSELGIARWPQHRFYLQHYYHALASAHIALYCDDGEAALRIVEDAWGGLKKSLFLNVQAVRTEAWYLRARAAIAARSPKALAIARRAEAALDADPVPAARGYAAAVRAALSWRKRDVEATKSWLREAERAFTRAGTGMLAAACKRHLGRLDASLRDELIAAEAWMRARGVVRPDRFSALLVPGIDA